MSAEDAKVKGYILLAFLFILVIALKPELRMFVAWVRAFYD